MKRLRYRPYRGKCSWRKRQIKRRARVSFPRLRWGAAAALALESAFLVPRFLPADSIRFSVLRREQSCQIEWILPQEAGREEIYGFRFCPRTWELQLYHRCQEGGES